MRTNKGAHGNQSGMVSFMVTLIMMMVITLIVIGFAQVTRRNEREALDRQLSSQAFYAAESGINATRSNMASFIATSDPSLLPAKTDCKNDYNANDPNGIGSGISDLSSNGVRYTCVLVDPTPDNLSVGATQSGSAILPLKTADPLTELTFEWSKQADPDSSCGLGVNALPPLAGWNCGKALVRVELAAIPGVVNSTSLDAATKVLFLTPQGAHDGKILSISGSDKAYMGSASGCIPPNATCTVTVTLPGTSNNYYARITTIYRDAKVSIRGITTTGSAEFVGAQAVVDVTGQAQDQLRRVQARVSLANQALSKDVPLAALSSNGSICKRFAIVPGASSSVSATNVCTAP